MSENIEEFLSPKQEQSVIDAIRISESNTSGEIRVHLENCCSSNPFERAIEIFSILKMHKTKLRNGVLIYIAVEERAFAIYGDEGINSIVPENFWDSTKDTIQSQFIKGDFEQGLMDGVLKVGEQLKQHFPLLDNDQNELSDSISKS
jgi:uncharacterized membrane protein